MSRIAVVIHLASLIALVLKFEPEGDVHGGRVSPNLVDQSRTRDHRRERGWVKKVEDGPSVAHGALK